MGVIRKIITGTESVTYIDDVINISRSLGYNPMTENEALIQWGESVGAEQGATWKHNLVNIAFKLTGITPVSWKTAIEHIRMYYEANPPEIVNLFCFTSLPYNPSAEYLLLSNKYITKNSYLFR